MDVSKKFIVQRSHMNEYVLGEFVRETKTLYIINVNGSESKFRKEDNSGIVPKGSWQHPRLLSQTTENYLKVDKYNLEQSTQVLSNRLNSLCGHHIKNMTLDEAQELDKSLKSAIALFNRLQKTKEKE